MNSVKCPSCGSPEILKSGSIYVCSFCRSKFANDLDAASTETGKIDLSDDIARLLRKCEEEPENSVQYANLILDIDPTNQQAIDLLG